MENESSKKEKVILSKKISELDEDLQKTSQELKSVTQLRDQLIKDKVRY